MSHRILSVASEAAPLVKTGGLADVVGALPGALAAEGCDMRVMIPAYPGLIARLAAPRVVWSGAVQDGPARLVMGQVPGAGWQAYLLDAPHLFDRPGGIYNSAAGDYPDNPERFAALCEIAARLCAQGDGQGWRPDLLHAHDWQAGLAPAYLVEQGIDTPSVITIHNMAFQGNAPADRLAALNLPAHRFTREGYEYWGQISTLKAGLITASAITTVSPRYAQELMRPEFGMGLEGVIAARAGVLSGILNGIDTAIWNPATDPEIAPFTADNLAGKAENRARLMAEFGLDPARGPLVVLVSRFSHQKGIDLIPDAAAALLDGGGALAMLGSGDPGLEAAMTDLAARHPGRIGLRLGYDEALSHRMYAGADAVLVPSRFEPCGLTQLYALRYGALPVVAATGGLWDSVIDATPAQRDHATGVMMLPTDALALSQAFRRLLAIHADADLFRQMQQNAMRADFGWAASARAYARLYRGLIGA
ncbi:glycogen synthase GlgA [Paracoccus sp. p4-l81]|uniref:glycogen synthase GlgA n=1 Tax=Paracoccus sp. p4-l81 TaxID=3342806 RepID=UPI0035BB8871